MNLCFLHILKIGRSTLMILLLSIFVGFSVAAFFPTFSDAQSEPKTFITHSGAIVQTSGEIIDPLYTVSTVEFDPMEYLREFNYGEISKLPDGQQKEIYFVSNLSIMVLKNIQYTSMEFIQLEWMESLNLLVEMVDNLYMNL